ncbi:hypothetical protein ACF090_42375 [Streptomyces sp. NPDC014892]|jgi:hypothetical protein
MEPLKLSDPVVLRRERAGQQEWTGPDGDTLPELSPARAAV